MTRVLDLDLDFFLRGLCPFAAEGARPDACGREPWTAEETREYLVSHLRLNPRRPIPGRAFETHDGALACWRELVGAGRLRAPFHITHVDAHSDLGVAQGENAFVRNAVLCRAPAARPDDYPDQLNEANYLLFALAYRWVGGLVNVRQSFSRADMPPRLLTPDGGHLQLKSAFPAIFEARYGEEPRVPYQEIANGREYVAPEPFDFLSLAISPRYAPREADALADVILEFAQA